MVRDPLEEPDQQREPSTNAHAAMRAESLNAALLVIAVLLLALVVWRASVAADAARAEVQAGTLAAASAEAVRALSAIEIYEDYRLFTGNIGDDAVSGQDAQEVPSANDFPRRYLNRDGSYNMARQLGEVWAAAARRQELQPAPHFANAARLQTKSGNLLALAVVMAAALVAYSLAAMIQPQRRRLVFMGAGMALSLGCLVALVIVEAGSRL